MDEITLKMHTRGLPFMPREIEVLVDGKPITGIRPKKGSGIRVETVQVERVSARDGEQSTGVLLTFGDPSLFAAANGNMLLREAH